MHATAAQEGIILRKAAKKSLMDLYGHSFHTSFTHIHIHMGSNIYATAAQGRMVLLRDCKKSFMDLVALFIGQFTKLVERANDERSDGSSDASKCLVHFFRVYSSLLQKDRKEQTELFVNQREDPALAVFLKKIDTCIYI
jgi:hypothetical protein